MDRVHRSLSSVSIHAKCQWTSQTAKQLEADPYVIIGASVIQASVNEWPIGSPESTALRKDKENN